MPLEIWGGYISRSFSLLSDGVHMTSHVIVLIFAFFAETNKKYIPHAVFTNGIFLIILAVYMICCAIYRILVPIEILSATMFKIALIGLFADFIQNVFLHHPAEDNHGLNIESIFEHNLSDMYLSLCIVGGSICIYIASKIPQFPGFYIDILLLLVFSPVVFKKGVRLIKKVRTLRCKNKE